MEIRGKKIDKTFMIFLICVVVIGGIAGIATASYNYFYNNNKEAVQALAANEDEGNEDEEISVQINPEDEIFIEGQLEEAEEQDQEEIIEISEEEKLKQEEEEKRLEEEQKKKKEEEEKRNAANYQYYLKVNYTANTVTAYKKDDDGNYTIPVRAMICSTGAATPTSGVYKTQNKYRWKLLIGNSYGQYSTRITGQILFHSVPYEKQSPDSIITKYYDRLGITTSLGCIRLTVTDAKWIYDNCPLGTSVEFYSSSNPGPLGKPGATKISNAGSPLDRWDPTDPDPSNPWRNQSIAQNEENEEQKVEETEKKEEQKNEPVEEKKEESTNNNKNTETNEKVEKNITVPNVVGKKEDAARSELSEFSITVEYKSDNTKVNGVVISQNLNPGASVSKQSKIVICINKIENIDNNKDINNNKDTNNGNSQNNSNSTGNKDTNNSNSQNNSDNNSNKDTNNSNSQNNSNNNGNKNTNNGDSQNDNNNSGNSNNTNKTDDKKQEGQNNT